MKRLFLLLATLTATARADLKWTSTTVFAAAAPSDGHADAEFSFTNTGTYPIKITSARTSCGCTAAVADERTIPPGGTGKIAVTFKTLNRHGLYEEPIIVGTDDPQAMQTTLTLRALIHDAVEILPTLLFWQKDEPLAPRVVEISVMDGFTVSSLEIANPNPGIDVKLDTVKAGAKYKLTVTPKSSRLKASVTITPRGDKPMRPQTVHIRVS